MASKPSKSSPPSKPSTSSKPSKPSTSSKPSKPSKSEKASEPDEKVNYVDNDSLDPEIETQWEDFKAQFKKKYKDKKEEEFRKQIFIKSLLALDEFYHKHEHRGITVKINENMDLTEQELRRLFHGAVSNQIIVKTKK